ncbi:hypothetical protein KSP39_PZI017668 [Platanthera zijinensis]|uniref:SOSEKI DIX-like domain-containing protein n=1 Tax=Platanthera zijinensis TaxID=2320716 RepID=A0AAP0B525_9ASPA
MAVEARGRPESWPERMKASTEPAKPKKVAVVYYLSRNGQLEHPHFMEVTLSSTDGLYLKDVVNRLDFLRGKGMATLYSWSSKRNYRNGFVWHDLSENDLIYPAHGQEYVLKGSELHLIRSSSSPTSEESAGSEMPEFLPERRKKTPWSSLDLGDYKAYKMNGASVKAMNEATQTDDEGGGLLQNRRQLPATEIDCDEISPPPSSSTSETVGASGGVGGEGSEQVAGGCASGGIRASATAALMNFISCGTFSVKSRGGGFLQPPRERAADSDAKEMDGGMDIGNFSAVRIREKEYFSGSLVDARKKKSLNADDGPPAVAGLKRSSSYNSERSSKLEIDNYPTRFMPTGKTTTSVTASEENATISRSAKGSKRVA